MRSTDSDDNTTLTALELDTIPRARGGRVDGFGSFGNAVKSN
ncbi:hypothetical protein AKJ09_01304 [Labilithrix luteola]|uniref:Uncharacterized protein n=1 Tax=Labilithrix luteola TaxID=1391654 RepID=A0A0K1PM85_9BACT|nr:hypothetical protein AKJ09_01304 [Labilithrix luteola]